LLITNQDVETHLWIIQYFPHFSTMGSFSSKRMQNLIQCVNVTGQQ